MTDRSRPSVDDLVAGIHARSRGMLARAITLVESRRPDDGERAAELLSRLTDSARARRTHRIGVTGVPGVGKSSFLEAFGSLLLEQDRQIAVLAIDPSSGISGGSLLGDKTRMTRLSHDQRAYVRPSPGAGELGGVARRTREAILVCEAFGFDTIFVETIGVGQSETAVHNLVDTFVLLMLAGAGDELQGIKRGITELADIMVVTKADGNNVERAQGAARELRAALRLLRGNASHPPDVLTCSAHRGIGLDAVRDAVDCHRSRAETDGTLQARRTAQAVHWFERCVDDAIRSQILADAAVRDRMQQARRQVETGDRQPFEAASWVISG